MPALGRWPGSELAGRRRVPRWGRSDKVLNCSLLRGTLTRCSTVACWCRARCNDGGTVCVDMDNEGYYGGPMLGGKSGGGEPSPDTDLVAAQPLKIELAQLGYPAVPLLA